MKLLIAGLGSIGRRHLCWLSSAMQSLHAFKGILNPSLPVEESAKLKLRFLGGVTGSTQLNYNQRPPAHPPEIVDPEITGRWISLIPGVP
jgi:hypothetical protein